MDLSDAIASYHADRRAKGIKEGTRRAERRVLGLLLADVGNINTRSLRPQHLDLFWSRRTAWAPGTMNHAASVLSSFFKWCQVRGHVRRDMQLMEDHRKLKVAPRDRITIPPSRFSELLSSCEAPRERITAAIGLYLFTRISETQDLRWQDWNEDSGTIDVFRTKTQTIDVLPVCSELRSELQLWRMEYGAILGGTPQPGWFIVPGVAQRRRSGTKGTKGFTHLDTLKLLPTTKANLGYTVKNLLDRGGYYRHMEGGHTLRRSGAVALYDRLSLMGHDRAIRVCQAMLGHANIATTEVYLRLSLDRKLRNDLLADKPMFPEETGAIVVTIERGQHGQASG